MLTRLVIQDFVLIDRLTVPFAGGLHAFTGETGAGKSIILDALGLALGGKGDAKWVRAGAAQASVTASFEAPFPQKLQTLAIERGFDLEEEVFLRRTLTAEGKSRAFLNDAPLTLGLLKEIGETLLEIHGQFDTHGLLNPASHRALLDAFGGLFENKEKTAQNYKDWHEAEEAFLQAMAEKERAGAEEDFLRSAVSELEEIAPMEGETERLAEKRSQLQNRDKIFEGLKAATSALEGERGALAALAQAGKYLARLAEKSTEAKAILDSVDRAANEAGEASSEIGKWAEGLEQGGLDLEKIEERLFALRAIARKHNVGVEALPSLCATLSARLALLEDKGDSLRRLSKAAKDAKALYEKEANLLSAARKRAALSLAKEVEAELPPVKLEKAKFRVEVEALEPKAWNADGKDRVQFLASTNPGMPEGPLQKIASGGELSRFMLALKVVLKSGDPVPTLVFDEVDAGIGGATASAVGERLARLGKEVQVLVVTHSPQVAARAGTQWRVSKAVKGQSTSTKIELLDDEARREEIARMLAGNEVTSAARQAAASLLEEGKAPLKAKRKGGK